MINRSVTLAAFLTFILPGLGHWYLGRRRTALVFMLPALLVGTAVGLTLLGGVDALLVYAITPSGSFTAFLLVVLAGVWRMIALLDVALMFRGTGHSIGLPSLAFVVVLLIAVLGMHGVVGYTAYSAYGASSRIFVAAGADDGPTATGTPSGNESSSGAPSVLLPSDDEFLATPQITPEPQKRVTVLLTGIDSAETRTTSLTDTILVVSLDPNTGDVSMLSLPRDISEFPLYNGKKYMGKINSLMTWARNHKADFPDGPLPTLMKEVGYLLGIPIHYYAAVDLAGFRRMIDTVGGVTVVNERAINDPRYEWLDGTFGFSMPAGKVKLDGRDALAFVRSRQGIGDTDFTRAARQQQLLLALRDELTRPSRLTELPAIIEVAGDTLRTNVPAERLEEFLRIARNLEDGKVHRVVLGPPYAVHPPMNTTRGTYILRLRMDKVKALSVKLFGDDSRYAKD